MPDPTTVLIYNPQAGVAPLTRAAALLPVPLPLVAPEPEPTWLTDACNFIRKETGAPPETIAVRTFAETAQAAKQASVAGASLVIAAGGDGTLRAVAEGLAGSDTALGILPRGTVNVFAREMGIPLSDTQKALSTCLHGDTRRVDMGRIRRVEDGTERYFLLMASVGFDALAVGNVRPEIKGMVGTPAYALSALASLASFTPPLLTLDLETGAAEPYSHGPAFMAVIANTASYGGDFRITPEARVDDGLLDVCLFEAPPGPPPLQAAAFVRQVSEILWGTHLLNPQVRYLRASHLRLDAAPSTALQIDGDALGETASIVVEAAPRALAVRVPAGSLDARAV